MSVTNVTASRVPI